MTSFLKTAGKVVMRSQEKMMQKLGKSEITTDEEFKEHVTNFNKQQAHTERLYKDTRAYLKAFKAMSQASKAFMDSLKVAYEPDWHESEVVHLRAERIDVLHNELHDRIQEDVAEPLSAYLEKFPEIKTRLAKRDRKVVDFDRCRREYDHAKQKGSAKLAQIEETKNEAERNFTEINNEMHSFLPSFYHARIEFYGSIFQAFFNDTLDFVRELGQICGVMCETMQSVAITQPLPHQHKSRPSKLGFSPSPTSVKHAEGFDSRGEPVSRPVSRSTPAYGTPREEFFDSKFDRTRKSQERLGYEEEDDEEDDDSSIPSSTDKEKLPPPLKLTAASPSTARPIEATSLPLSVDAFSTDRGLDSTNSHSKLRSDVIEVRVATHNYASQNEDELPLQKGDLIEVIPFTDPDDEEDGWLNGRVRGRIGVFPSNFTARQRPL
eukprot:m.142129 g.142129  ORF g.142129 m.142129 type:complete len:435 (-) comp52612_c0_seq2:132-1436(-)